jgi:DNA-binding XRE family transcriptional regulator
MADFKISLTAARVNANMTQDQVAEALKVSKNTIISWEKGRTQIPFATLVTLCELYQAPIDHIFIPSDLTLS